MDFLKKLLVQLKDFFKEVDPGTKLLTILFGSVFIIAIIVAVFLNRKPGYSLLYPSVNEATAAEIISFMDDNNIDYQLKNNGRDIYVEKHQANHIRLLLKKKGLPKDGEGVGFEIFDRVNLGVTDFVQNKQYIRALCGELERTITQIKGVQDARVHIVLPEERVFEEDKKETTATVLLTLNYLGALDNLQVNSIRQLTASSVEGLKPKNVTIVDNFGNVLAVTQDSDESIGLMNNRMEIQKNLENYYNQKVQGLLDSVLGKDQAVVRVDALLDFDKIEETEEKFDPESAVVRAEVITNEKNTGESNVAEGPPGVQTNMTPGNKGSGYNSQQNNSTREVINNKYEIDKKIRHIIKGVGDVKKLTVSVFLKQKPQLDAEGKPATGDKGKILYEERTQEQMKVFSDIVKNAIGFDEKRGDGVVVKEVPFQKKIMPESVYSSGGIHWSEWLPEILRFTGLIVVLLVLILVLVRRVPKDTIVPTSVTKKQRPDEEEDEGDLDDIRAKGLKAVEKGAFIETEVGKVVEKFPSETELVLKRWLKE